MKIIGPNMNDYKNKFTCPITKLIFFEPIIAEDGIIYEEKALLDWFKKSDISPTTGKKILKTYFKPIQFRDELNNFLLKNPKFKENQFKIFKKYNKDKIIKIIHKKNFKQLLYFSKFKLDDYISYLDMDQDNSDDSSEISSLYSSD